MPITQEKTARNLFLDNLKAFACISVVLIHVRFPGNFGLAVNQIAQFAVPIFLMISGYYLYGPSQSSKTSAIKHIRRLSEITIISVIIYFLYTLYFMNAWGMTRSWLASFLDYKQWVQIIIFSNLDIISGNHLWFLPAQIIAYAIILIIIKTNSFSKIYYFMPIMFIIRIILTSLYEANQISWHYRDNFLIEALPWMLLGHFIAHQKELIAKLNSKLVIIVALIGLIISLSLTLCDFSINLAEIGNTIYSVALFILAINNPSITFGKSIEFIGQKLSLYVYVSHIAINGIFGIVAALLGMLSSNYFEWIRPLAIIVLSLALSAIIYFSRKCLSKKI